MRVCMIVHAYMWIRACTCAYVRITKRVDNRDEYICRHSDSLPQMTVKRLICVCGLCMLNQLLTHTRCRQTSNPPSPAQPQNTMARTVSSPATASCRVLFDATVAGAAAATEQSRESSNTTTHAPASLRRMDAGFFVPAQQEPRDDKRVKQSEVPRHEDTPCTPIQATQTPSGRFAAHTPTGSMPSTPGMESYTQQQHDNAEAFSTPLGNQARHECAAESEVAHKTKHVSTRHVDAVCQVNGSAQESLLAGAHHDASSPALSQARSIESYNQSQQKSQMPASQEPGDDDTEGSITQDSHTEVDAQTTDKAAVHQKEQVS
jgi:hypothetical protein